MDSMVTVQQALVQGFQALQVVVNTAGDTGLGGIAHVASGLVADVLDAIMEAADSSEEEN